MYRFQRKPPWCVSCWWCWRNPNGTHPGLRRRRSPSRNFLPSAAACGVVSARVSLLTSGAIRLFVLAPFVAKAPVKTQRKKRGGSFNLGPIFSARRPTTTNDDNELFGLLRCTCSVASLFFLFLFASARDPVDFLERVEAAAGRSEAAARRDPGPAAVAADN